MQNTFIKLEDVDGNIISKSIDEIIGKKVAIHCDTEEKANEFLKKLDDVGVTWNDGGRTIDYNRYEVHEEDTCYDLKYGKNELSYCNKGFYLSEGDRVYEYTLSENAKRDYRAWDLEVEKEYLETTTHDANTIFKMNRYGELVFKEVDSLFWKDVSYYAFLKDIFKYKFTEKKQKTQIEKEIDGLLKKYNKAYVLEVLNRS